MDNLIETLGPERDVQSVEFESALRLRRMRRDLGCLQKVFGAVGA